MSWSLKFDECQKCGTTERRHEGKGLCARCSSNARYHDNIEQKRAQRKLARLRAPIEKTAAEYAKQKAWKDANRERALASQKAHYERNKATLNAYPIGGTFYVKESGSWRKCTIVKRINNMRVLVQIGSGNKQLEVGLRSGRNLLKEKPKPGCEPQKPKPVVVYGQLDETSREYKAYMLANVRLVGKSPYTLNEYQRKKLRIAAGVTLDQHMKVLKYLRTKIEEERSATVVAA